MASPVLQKATSKERMLDSTEFHSVWAIIEKLNCWASTHMNLVLLVDLIDFGKAQHILFYLDDNVY